LLLSVGNKVNYPSRGPCLVGPVVKKIVGGKLAEFHRLIVLDDSGAELFVPFGKAPVAGVRRLLDIAEIPGLLEHLKRRSVEPAKNWKQRALNNVKLVTSGSAFDLAEVVESLTELSRGKTLAPGDHQTLERARKLLVCEISEVTGKDKGAVEERIDRALGDRKRGVESGGNKTTRRFL
jgi:RNA polymerase-interacting CarD/CdnL/TRCF family regulator